jgi:hypothetical protein
MATVPSYVCASLPASPKHRQDYDMSSVLLSSLSEPKFDLDMVFLCSAGLSMKRNGIQDAYAFFEIV